MCVKGGEKEVRGLVCVHLVVPEPDFTVDDREADDMVHEWLGFSSRLRDREDL